MEGGREGGREDSSSGYLEVAPSLLDLGSFCGALEFSDTDWDYLRDRTRPDLPWILEAGSGNGAQTPGAGFVMIRASEGWGKGGVGGWLKADRRGGWVPNLVFLAVSPEEKESWISILNTAITRAKNRILDEVTVEDESPLSHPTRDRPKIPHSRRLPTRGHLMAVASTSSSDGMLTLDFIQEEGSSTPEGRGPGDSSPRSTLGDSDIADPFPSPWLLPPSSRVRAKSGSLPRGSVPARDWLRPGGGQCRTPQPGKRAAAPEKNRCVSMEEILSRPRLSGPGPTPPITIAMPPAIAPPPIEDLISQKLERTQELLEGARSLSLGRGRSDSGGGDGGGGGGQMKVEKEEPEAERLLREAVSAWGEAKEVLEEVKELQVLFRKLDLGPTASPSSCPRQHMTDS
ncbi:hypothetical protein JZ751_007231 [Albula glossodonta]|uniref:Pleckstrin homology domain-containing family O member 1 n=1 Tax=Albula glossodonta TaxID=121402 RepID=A0A8T2N445_9TELE|nr:hypothetical protein JZ751_007231 [Albula glossodonta]